jgi:hypothetical protein
MDRVLRVLAIIALVSLGVSIVLGRLLDAVQQPAMGSGFPSVTDLLLPALPSILVNLIGETGSALCLAVGVVAVVASIQRRQQGWAVGLLVLLFVATDGPTLVTEVGSDLAVSANNDLAYAFGYTYMPYIGLLLIALVPLAVLVYTIRFRRRAAQPIEPAVVAE